MISLEHLSYLSGIIHEVNVNNIEGSIVECGVWKGGCCMWMAMCQMKYDMSRMLYLYDTFEGMTFPDSINDGALAVSTFNKISTGVYNRPYDSWHGKHKWAFAPIDYVSANMQSTGYDSSKIVYVKGDIMDTLNDIIPTSISVLRLDTDWYNSTKKELDVLFPLVSSGGYVIVDDYYAWQGSQIATDEFLRNNKDKISMIDPAKTGNIFVFRKL